MATSEDGSELKEINMFLFDYCRISEVEAVPERDLIHFISQRVPVHKIKYFIDALLATGAMKIDGLNIPGRLKYRPIPISLYKK